jgi:hypothetical protein
MPLLEVDPAPCEAAIKDIIITGDNDIPRLLKFGSHIQY